MVYNCNLFRKGKDYLCYWWLIITIRLLITWCSTSLNWARMWLSIVMMKSVLSKCASCRQSTSSSVQALVRQWKQKGRTPLFAHLPGKSQCWAFAWGINVWGTSSVEKYYVRLLSCTAKRLLFFIQMKGCFMDYQIHFRWYVIIRWPFRPSICHRDLLWPHGHRMIRGQLWWGCGILLWWWKACSSIQNRF